jgi:SAM-dependent methyltransferase
MRTDFAARLRSPDSGAPLELRVIECVGAEVITGSLVTPDGAFTYPIRGGIPRFVPGENYASSFGYQWNRFRRTQLDSHSGVPISRERFHRYSGWAPAELRGSTVLDAGCGAGRFTEIVLEAGADVVAIDFSAAADACRENHRERPNLEVLQADVYRLPFEPSSFEFVFCLGVLQHTPDPGRAFAALARQVAPGGRIAVDVYPRLFRNVLWPKYWLRPLTRRLPSHTLIALVERMVPVLLPVSSALGRIPRLGHHLRHAVPVANYDGVYPLSGAQLREWAILDTFDMFASAHDYPQTAKTVRGWFMSAGFDDIRVERAGFIVARGRKPATVAGPVVRTPSPGALEAQRSTDVRVPGSAR